ncbi:hypothetical protein LCGC14_1110590 [marine sediment metagenome]|uniref:Uncharacterized protein n=1 Tax=marine sediment metagenome TaxID=412755 RepID=A0A0F9PPW2_9ZZZZ
MPRGQDAPTQGIKIDPYVQQSLLQGKQQANDRLVAAMQQAGAGERQREAGTQKAVSQGMSQAHEQKQMNIQLAAQAEMEDKRAATAEAASRADNQFTSDQNDLNRTIQVEQAQLERDLRESLAQDAMDHADKLATQSDELAAIQMELDFNREDRTINAILSSAKGTKNIALLNEKTETQMLKEQEKFTQNQGTYETTKEEILADMEFDKRMDLPIKGEAITKAVLAGSGMGFTAGFTRVRTGEIKPGTQADPMGVLQDMLSRDGGQISVEDLDLSTINNVADQMAEGKIVPEDITTAFATLDSMQETIKDRRGAYVDRKSDGFKFWHKHYLNVGRMRTALKSLRNNSKQKIAGSNTETVATRMLYSINVVSGNSLGGRADSYQKLHGGQLKGILDSLTPSMEPYPDLTVSEGISDYGLNWITRINEMQGQRRAGSTETLNWGAE